MLESPEERSIANPLHFFALVWRRCIARWVMCFFIHFLPKQKGRGTEHTQRKRIAHTQRSRSFVIVSNWWPTQFDFHLAMMPVNVCVCVDVYVQWMLREQLTFGRQIDENVMLHTHHLSLGHVEKKRQEWDVKRRQIYWFSGEYIS